MGYFQIFLTSFLLLFARQSTIPYAAIEKAFSTGDAQGIAAMGKDKMLITILGKEGAYSQSQATLVLRDFFSKKPVSSFKFIFKGKESADGSFAIGNYESKGEVFRITIHFQKLGNDFKIESISVEKD